MFTDTYTIKTRVICDGYLKEHKLTWVLRTQRQMLWPPAEAEIPPAQRLTCSAPPPTESPSPATQNTHNTERRSFIQPCTWISRQLFNKSLEHLTWHYVTWTMLWCSHEISFCDHTCRPRPPQYVLIWTNIAKSFQTACPITIISV